MTVLQKSLIAGTVAASIGAAIYQTFRVSRVCKENETSQRQQVSLLARLEALQHDLDDATNRLAALTGSKTEADNAAELLRLRGRVTSLQRELNDTASGHARNGVTTDSDPNSVLDRINLLKRALKERPGSAIPEIGILNDGDWLRISRSPMLSDLESEEGLRRALSQVRQAAKTKFASRLGSAVSSYAAANSGQLPMDTLQLKPYLDSQKQPFDLETARSRALQGPPDFQQHQTYPPTEDATLQRYRMIQRGTTSDLRPGQPIIAEAAPVDPEFDTLFQIGLKSFFLAGTGKSKQTGWGGSEPPDLQSLTPEQRESYENSMKRLEAAKQRGMEAK